MLNSYERSEWVYRTTPGHTEEDLLGVLGITGLTAYFGVREVGRLKPGQTVVVGGASGACGAIEGQLARIAGCRVIGFAGGQEKCSRIVDELGFDAAVDYKREDAAEVLAEHCPDGIDFLSDAVGGAVTKSSLPLMKDGAGWFHFGNVSTLDASDAANPPSILDSVTPALLQLCEQKNVSPEFLYVFDYYCERRRAEEELAGYVQDGLLKAPTTTFEGFEHLPDALVEGTLSSNKFGKLNVRLAD